MIVGGARLGALKRSSKYFSDAKKLNNISGVKKGDATEAKAKVPDSQIQTSGAGARAADPCEEKRAGTNVEAKIKDFEDIPGPRSIPIFGTLWMYLPLIGEYSFRALHANSAKRHEKYGPIVREEILPGVRLLHLADPADVEALMRASGRFPERRSHVALRKYRESRPEVYNTGGLLPTNGAEWWQIRSLFQKPLSSPKKASLYVHHTDSVVDEFVERIKEVHCARTDPRDVTDFLQDLSRLNLQLICLIAFDVRINSFTPEELRPDSLSTKLISATLTSNANTVQIDNMPEIFTDIRTPAYKRLSKAQDYLEKVAVNFILQKMTFYNEETANTRAEPSLLESYLSDPDIDLKDLVGMSVDLLLAGVDTTSFSTSFALYHLAKNPEVQQKLYEEAVKLLPLPNDPVTAEVLNNASYVKACIKESLRINPISVGIGRTITQDMVLSGYHIPKGTIAVTANHLISNLPEYFENSHEFLPERWLRGSARYRPGHPYASIPFGHGPRMCIARRIAEQNMHITLLKLVRNFEIGWVGRDLGIVTVTINKPDGPVRLTFSRRNGRSKD